MGVHAQPVSLYLPQVVVYAPAERAEPIIINFKGAQAWPSLERFFYTNQANNHIHVSVSDCYIPTMGLPILLLEICGPTLGLYKSLTDTWVWKLGLRPRNSQKRNTYLGFSLQCGVKSCPSQFRSGFVWSGLVGPGRFGSGPSGRIGCGRLRKIIRVYMRT